MKNDLPEGLKEIQEQLYNVGIATGLGILHGLEDEHSKGDLVSLIIGTHISTAAFFVHASGLDSRRFTDGIAQLMQDMQQESPTEDPSTSLFAGKQPSEVN